MKQYSLKKSECIPNETIITVWELCKNNKSLFSDFIEEVEKDNNLFPKFAGVISIIEKSCNLKRLPQTKFKLIKGHKIKNCKIYEAKSGSLRVYMFHEEKTGRIIVTGGTKNKQSEDIKSLTKIIKEYQDEK